MNCLKKFRNSLSSADMFGHPVLLNFNRKGDHYKTVCGGLFTLIYAVIMIWFLVYKIASLATNNDSRIV